MRTDRKKKKIYNNNTKIRYIKMKDSLKIIDELLAGSYALIFHGKMDFTFVVA